MLLIVRKFPLFFVFPLPVSVSKRSELSKTLRLGAEFIITQQDVQTTPLAIPDQRIYLF